MAVKAAQLAVRSPAPKATVARAAIDPILIPRKYDARQASPRLLEGIETSLSHRIGGKATPVYRGFSLPDYGGPELVRYLMGDWRGVIASHTFSSHLRRELTGGQEFHVALKRAARQVGDSVLAELARGGYESFAFAQSRRTQIGVADKSATAMSSYRYTSLDKPMLTPTSFGYATSGYYRLVNKRTLAPTHPKIMVDVVMPIPSGYKDAEYLIPSHVPPTKIRRFFLGFSNYHDVREHAVRVEEKTSWYGVDVGRRGRDGRPIEFTVRPVEVTVNDWSLMERARYGKQRWTSLHPDSPEARVFAEQHPLLAPTLAEIRQQLEQHRQS